MKSDKESPDAGAEAGHPAAAQGSGQKAGGADEPGIAAAGRRPVVSPARLTVEDVQRVLDEAGGQKTLAAKELIVFHPPQMTAAGPGGAMDLIKQFPAMWPGIRPLVLGVVGLLKLLRRGDAAAGLSAAVAWIDLMLGGGLPNPAGQ